MRDDAGLAVHRGQRAVQRLVEFAPSTGGLALWIEHADLDDDDPAAGPDAPPLATDGRALRYTRAFERLPIAEQAGWIARGVLHVALRHPQRLADMRARLGDVDERLFGLCADAIVDASLAELDWLALPASAVPVQVLMKVALGVDLDADEALRDWDVERLYREIDDRRPEPSGRRAGTRSSRGGRGGGSGDGAGGGSKRGAGSEAATNAGARIGAGSSPRSTSDAPSGAGQRDDAGAGGTAALDVIDADDAAQGERPLVDGPCAARARALARAGASDLLSPPTTDAPEARAAQALAWAERLMRAHAGDGEFSILRTLAAARRPVRTPWEQVLRVRLAHALSRRPALSWSRPSRSWLANGARTTSGRRMPWEPGWCSSSAAPRLAVVIDASGSVDDALMARFMREIDAIVRRLEAAVTVIVGDERVRHVVRYEPGRASLGALKIDAGGGTDFTPLLQEADAHRPDAAVVLTDLQGPARFKPGWPVYWAVPEAFRDATAPFGRVVVLT